MFSFLVDTATKADFWALVQRALEVGLAVFLPSVIAVIAAYIRSVIKEVQRDRDFAFLLHAVSYAVDAAEKLGITGELEQFAETKLEYAIALVEAQLVARGIELDLDGPVDIIRGLIEAELQRKS